MRLNCWLIVALMGLCLIACSDEPCGAPGNVQLGDDDAGSESEDEEPTELDPEAMSLCLLVISDEPVFTLPEGCDSLPCPENLPPEVSYHIVADASIYVGGNEVDPVRNSPDCLPDFLLVANLEGQPVINIISTVYESVALFIVEGQPGLSHNVVMLERSGGRQPGDLATKQPSYTFNFFSEEEEASLRYMGDEIGLLEEDESVRLLDSFTGVNALVYHPWCDPYLETLAPYGSEEVIDHHSFRDSRGQLMLLRLMLDSTGWTQSQGNDRPACLAAFHDGAGRGLWVRTPIHHTPPEDL